LKDKHLLDVFKALKIKDLMHSSASLSHVFSKIAQNCKATAKKTAKHQIVENQALDEILCSKA
jgi:hypothetical protein